MIWILTGTVAFGLLILFEYQKCRNVRRNVTGRNPWFLLGTAVLVFSFLMMGKEAVAAEGTRLAVGIILLAAGLLFYAAVLRVATGPQQQGYMKDLKGTAVSRKGLYGHMRHPGVWSFLLCSVGFGTIFSEGMVPALWFTFLNLIYTWLQDRYFFPVYLTGYEGYKNEVPFLFPKLR